MKIAVVGTGYVGLVSGACLADLGHEVVCIDCDAAKIAQLRRGRSPIFEPGLDDLLAKVTASGTLSFTTDLAGGIQGAEVVFIAVGTPDRSGNGIPDLTNIFLVARDIADALTGYCVVVTKSTVPLGTGDGIEKILTAHAPASACDVVSNPEFLREGTAIDDFARPDRIVIGTDSPRAREVMGRLFDPRQFGGAPVIFTSRRTAELTKYAANAFLAMKVAFINEIADVCERASGADISDLARGVGLDSRIGPAFFKVGPGFGGSCLPKDTRALVESARQCGAPSGLVQAVVQANRNRKVMLVERVMAACGGSVAGREIALLGLTFKAGTDDMRESPAIPLAEALYERGARVRAYDPAGMRHANRLLPAVKLAKDAYTCLAGAHAAVLVTDWPAFRELDLGRMRATMAQPVFVDFRNMFSALLMQGAGFSYTCLGAAPPRHVPDGIDRKVVSRASRVPERRAATPVEG